MLITLLTARGCAHAQGLPEIPVAHPDQYLKEADYLFPQRPAKISDKKTMSINWHGESVREDEGTLILAGGALDMDGPIGNLSIKADAIEYNRFEQTIKAVGDVRMEHPEFKMLCRRLEMKLTYADDDIIPSGEAWEVTFELPPTWTLNSRLVRFVSYPGDSLGFVGKLMGGGKADTTTEFHFEEVSVTPCPQRNPDWIAKASGLELKTGTYSDNSGLQGYATLKNLVLKLGRVPILWMPLALFPARIDRAPGLLPPTIGFNGQLGATLGLSYFQPLGATVDLTFSPTWYSKEGFMWSLESRWEPEVTHKGSVNMRYIRPNSTKEARYRLNLHEIWDLENGWFVRADVNQASDQMMDVEFGTVSRSLLGTAVYNSSLYVGKNFKWAAFSVFASEQRTFFQPDDHFYNINFPGSMQKLKTPEGQLRLYPVAIGNFYLDGSARIGRFGYSLDLGDDVPRASYYWNRSDYQLRLQGRLGHIGPFRADLQLGARFTQYGAVLKDSYFDIESPDGGNELPPNPIDNPEFDPFRVEGPSTQRMLGSSRIQISTPQLGRSFLNLKVGKYSGDIKHILEPYIAFVFNSKHKLAGQFPRFDEADVRPGVGNSAAGERSAEFGVNQHLFGRPDSTYAYTHAVRFNLSVKYYFDPIILADGRVRQGLGSFDGKIDVEPSETLRLSFRRVSEHLGDNTDTSMSADLAVGKKTRFNLAFFTTGFNQLRIRQRGVSIGGQHKMWNDKLYMTFEANYDYERKIFSQGQVVLAYVSPCVEYSIKYYHIALPAVSLFAKEDRVDFAISLKNLGELFSADVGGLFSGLFK